MSYPYSIVRNGYVVPLTSVYSGYNPLGTTPGFGGMGIFQQLQLLIIAKI